MKTRRMQIRIALLMLLPILTAGCVGAPEPPAAEPTAVVQTIVTAAPTATQPSAEPDATAASTATQPSAEPDATAALPAPYADILAQYADAMQAGYYRDVAPEARDAAFGESVALEWRINPAPAWYALYDFDRDGVNELCIGAGEDASAPAYYDIWRYADGQAVRPFDMDFGYRVQLSLYADGVIEITWSDSAFSSGFDFYRLNGARAERVAAFATEADPANPEALLYLVDGAAVDEAAFTQALQAYESKEKAALDWVLVAAAD